MAGVLKLGGLLFYKELLTEEEEEATVGFS
jgi:hypothetical protein